MPAALIPEDLVDFLESGISILLGTADAAGRPDAARATGALVAADRRALTVFLPEAWSSRALANLRANPEIAVGFSRPIDHTSVQAKGRVTEMRAGSDDERRAAERYHAAYVEQLYLVGIPRNISRRIIIWPSLAVSFAVRELFMQTPGPDAGKAIVRR